MLRLWIQETPEADRLVVAIVDAGAEADTTGGKMLAFVSACCCICAGACFGLVVANNAVFVFL